jgi:polysaccharide deacetylase 2 family uncharacterized protein YibQ
MRFPAWARHMPKPQMIWGALCVLLAFGVLSSVLHFASEHRRELLRAIAAEQHLEFDAATGKLLAHNAPAPTSEASQAERPSTPKTAANSQFDVAEESAVTPSAPAAPRGDGNQPTRPPVIPAGEEEAAAAGATLIRNAPPAINEPLQRTDESLVAAPALEISMKTPYGVVPKVNNGSSASTLYARRYRLPEGSMPLSIVVSGLGFSRDALNIALSLPHNVAFSFSPYAPELTQQIARARISGHEVWAELPAQNADYPATDPGPLGQIASLSDKKSHERMLQWMAATHGAVGALLAADENVSEYGTAMRRILQDLAKHGLMLLYSEPARAKQLPAMPDRLLADVADLRIEGTQSRAAVNSQLSGLIDAVQREGAYILVVEATPHMLKLLKAWTEQLPEVSPVKLAPLSALYLDPRAKAAK